MGRPVAIVLALVAMTSASAAQTSPSAAQTSPSAAQQPGDTAVARGVFTNTDRSCRFPPFRDTFRATVQDRGLLGLQIHLRQPGTGEEGVFRRDPVSTDIVWVSRGRDEYTDIRIDGDELTAEYTYRARGGCRQTFDARFTFPAGFLSALDPPTSVASPEPTAASPASDVIVDDMGPPVTLVAIAGVVVLVGLGALVLLRRRARSRRIGPEEPAAPENDEELAPEPQPSMASRGGYPAPIVLRGEPAPLMEVRREPAPPAPRANPEPAPPAPRANREPAPPAPPVARVRPPAPPAPIATGPAEIDLSLDDERAVPVEPPDDIAPADRAALVLTGLQVMIRATCRDLPGFRGGRDDRALVLALVHVPGPDGSRIVPATFASAGALAWEHRSDHASGSDPASPLGGSDHALSGLDAPAADLGDVLDGVPLRLVWCGVALVPAPRAAEAAASLRARVDGTLRAALERATPDTGPLLGASALNDVIAGLGLSDQAAIVPLDRARASDVIPAAPAEPLLAEGPAGPVEGPVTRAHHDGSPERTIRIFWYPSVEAAFLLER